MAEFWEELKMDVFLAFIFEDRWKYYVSGFFMTLLLTVSSFVLGSLVGALFCRLKFSKRKGVVKAVSLITKFLIQIPTLVLLMFFVYLIFAGTSLSVVTVVIIGLTFKAGAYLSDIYYTAIDSLDRGEAEAASSLGMTKLQVFRYIVFPQAVRNALPVYKNQLIITMQETSIVSYMAIMDLTRASEYIITRTFNAFFSLITITILYMILGVILTWIVGIIGKEKHFDEKALKALEGRS